MHKGHLGLYAVLASVAGFGAGPVRGQGYEIHWLGDYREAIRQARQTRKPIFLEFRCEA